MQQGRVARFDDIADVSLVSIVRSPSAAPGEDLTPRMTRFA